MEGYGAKITAAKITAAKITAATYSTITRFVVRTVSVMCQL